MKTRAIIDTGPLVALIKDDDDFHDWVTEQLGQIGPPLLSCEAVIAEALFLLSATRGGAEAVLGMIADGFLRLPFRLESEVATIKRLRSRYASVPMSLADACLVRMSEQHSSANILTIDSDFRIYRRHRREPIPTLCPR